MRPCRRGTTVRCASTAAGGEIFNSRKKKKQVTSSSLKLMVPRIELLSILHASPCVKRVCKAETLIIVDVFNQF
jgi:hypothetical protein